MTKRGSKEWKDAISKSRIGQKAWNTGLTASDPRVKKYSVKLKNRVMNAKWRKKISDWHKGKQTWNKGLKGVMPIPWNKGKKTGRNKAISNENHYLWKGNFVGYTALHSWLGRKYGTPEKCEKCGSIKNVEWANKSGQYLRNRNDWMNLCKSCHNKFDKRINNFKK